MSDAPPLQQELREFHLFPNLPIEIRWMVWHYTWEPKTVEVFECVYGCGIVDRYTKWLPISSQVHKESRRETLMFYKSAFTNAQNRYCFFNFDLDNLLNNSCRHMLRWLDSDDCQQLQRLSVSLCIPLVAPDIFTKSVTESFEAREIEEFLDKKYPKLKQITVLEMTWEKERRPFQS
ncbi:hypothetical protein RRF57_010300 [Xylaria bambusicola]|uniref:2EXR domain-containing protein n=1 Tax=Xylaria bambusicola TaxID=326684 RepID=A0AAN7US78_9PEZI